MNFMFIGRWDLTVQGSQRDYASWFELSKENEVLKGRFVGIEGSSRPMTKIQIKGDELYFHLPPQFEKHQGDLIFKGKLVGNYIEGQTNDENNKWINFSAVPAPKLPLKKGVIWGEPEFLINEDLDNWVLRYPDGPNGWNIKDGILRNIPPSTDLLTKEKFSDFTLHSEFRIPENGNSGIYIRGRYEVQIVDDHHREPGLTTTGSVYGFLKPNKKMTKPSGEWNSIDITLVGRWVSIDLNGETIIDNQEIPGLTGGALNSREDEPGPIMLQGDHRAVEYRNLIIKRST